MKSVTGDVKLKSWFYLCRNGANIANSSARWKINIVFSERYSSCSSIPASLSTSGSLGLSLKERDSKLKGRYKGKMGHFGVLSWCGRLFHFT